MSDVKFEISIEGDSEGYVTFECPFCESEFKLNADEFQDEDNVFSELFCPYCGLIDKVNKFYSKEVIEQAEAIVVLQLYKLTNTDVTDLKIEAEELKKVNLKELKDKDTTEEIFSCPMCENHIRVLYCAGVSKVFCAYCGVDI